jgi:hypothetical protein
MFYVDTILPTTTICHFPLLTQHLCHKVNRMAGGIKSPVNIFRLKNQGEPNEVFNWRLWFAVLSFSLLGAARGVDEGLISGAFNSEHFQRSIHYSSYTKVEQANIKANVSAMVLIGSVGGALM